MVVFGRTRPKYIFEVYTYSGHFYSCLSLLTISGYICYFSRFWYGRIIKLNIQENSRSARVSRFVWLLFLGWGPVAQPFPFPLVCFFVVCRSLPKRVRGSVLFCQNAFLLVVIKCAFLPDFAQIFLLLLVVLLAVRGHWISWGISNYKNNFQIMRGKPV